MSREIVILAILFVLSEIVNLVTIIRFDRPASELLSQLGFVLILTLGTYLLLWIVRIVVLLALKIFKIK